MDCTEDIVISLATYGKRFQKLEKTLPSIINQNVPYKKLVINVQDDLSDEDFDKFLSFEKLDSRVIVRKRPRKWRSFNKYVHTYFEFKGSIIITCDDDISYEQGYFSALYEEWKKHKDCIICHEINPMLLDENGRIVIFNSIDVKLRETEFGKYLTGCCLFPPECFDGSEIKLDDFDKFMELTNGTHDEIWLWVLSTLMGIQCVGLDYTFSFDLDGCALPAEDTALCHINGKQENIKKYEDKINELYGDKLTKIMRNKPCTFYVRRDNFMAILGNMQWINYIFKNFNVIFDCNEDEINKSMLINLVNSINKCRWYNKISVIHGKLMGNRNG